MNDFDRAVDRWLNDGSDTTPPAVIDAALLAVTTTPQERDFRVSWRTAPMKSLPYAMAAVAVVAVAVSALAAMSPRFGIGAGPTPSAAIDQTPDGAAAPFESTVHGISIDYPSGWKTRPATGPWNHDAITFDAPDVDVIFDPAHEDDLYFALVSEPLNGQSGSEWCCTEPIVAAQICARADGFGGGRYTLDDATGWIQTCGRGDHVVLVATATRGYLIQLHVGDPQLGETYDEDWFEAALATVELTSE